MKKKISVVICLSLIAASIIVLVSCSKQHKENENKGSIETGGEIDGGWTKADSPVITNDFKKVFEKAISELDGVDYTPIAYLASQVVAGTNHCVLCKATPVVPDAKTTYSIVCIYEDLEGNATVTEVIASDADAPSAEGGIVGGWSETESLEMTDDAETAFEKACETLTGAEYTPVALLGTQVVAGTNYRIICESRPSVPSDECGYVIVTVYADLEGNAKIIDTIEFRHKDIIQGSGTANSVAAVDGNMKTYYEMDDGTWMCDDYSYKYRLEIKGRMPNAAVDSTFVFLSNIEKISFEQAYRAAGVSSYSGDYFSPEEAVLVELY
ncbi:MAG: hypothetical protein IK026_07185 [Eubacteriaceae bacterium]|nr:hypothetical protein [Eubacteriaceae bacterium]